MAQSDPDARPVSTTVIQPDLLIVSCLWGVGNLLTKVVLDVFEPAGFMALRTGVASILFGALLFTVPRRRIAPRDWLMLTLFGGGVVALQLFSFTYAMKLTTGSEGSLLISTAPVWTAAMVAALGMEQVTRLNWLGIAVASVGVVMIVLGPGSAVPANAPARLTGDAIMIGSAWLYAGYMVLSRRWMQRLGELPVICITFAASGVMLTVLGAHSLSATDWSKVTAGYWLAAGHVTVLAGVLGIIMWYRAIGRTSANRTAVYQYLVPVVSVIGATAFMGERMVMLQLVGIAVTLIGVYAASVPPAPQPAAEAAAGPGA